MKIPKILNVEELWDHLLSRNAQLITAAYKHLSCSDQNSVIEHLSKMTREEGWQTMQKESAQAALLVIQNMKKGSKK